MRTSFISLISFLTTVTASSSFGAPKADDQELIDIVNEANTSLSETAAGQEVDPPAQQSVYVAPLHFKTLMTKIDYWKKPNAKYPDRNTVSYCMSKVRKFQCEKSDFKDLKFMDRYQTLAESIEVRMANEETSRGLVEHKNAVACIMSRETGVLEPITVSFANCTPDGFGSDLGLGQVTMRTFLHVIGLTNTEINKTVNHYFGRNGYKKKKLILTDERANALPIVTSVHPFNTLEYRKNPMRMYEEMADSYEFQIDMTLEVLKEKKSISQNDAYLAKLKAKIDNPKLTPKQKIAAQKVYDANLAYMQQKTYENYNGSETKVKYGAAVYACRTCLDAGKKDTAYCLGLAMGTKKLTDFTVCKK